MNKKRDTLKRVAGVTAIVALAPTPWTKPILNSVALPAHAQTSMPTPPPPTLSVPEITIGDLGGAPFSPLTTTPSDPADAATRCILGICDYSDLAVSQFTTNCDSGCIYSQTGFPPGVNIDPDTGDISGSFNSTAIETFFVTVTVTSLGGSATSSFSLSFVDEG